MSLILPPTIAISSTWDDESKNHYLNFCDDPEQEAYGFLTFSGDNVFSPLAKFEVVTANTGTGLVTANTGTGLVHIRCAYNKKYLRRKDETSGYIAPKADEPDEDQAKWSCTLFEPLESADGDSGKAKLRHVQMKLYVTPFYTGSKDKNKNYFLCNRSFESCTYDIADLESLVILPRHVAFKGHTGYYLKIVSSGMFQFVSKDKGLPECWFEVYTNGHGRVQIKSRQRNSYLFNMGNRIQLYDSSPDMEATDPRTLFMPVKVSGNAIALRSLCDNNYYCAQYSDANGSDFLHACYGSIAADSRFILKELVLSRKIYNTDFDLKNAIIYGETPITMATANASNDTAKDNTAEFRFEYKDSTSSMWNSSSSWSVGMEVSVSFKIPFIGGTDVSISGEYADSYEEGTAVTTENTLETTYTATVPANTSISVSLMATRGKCDVPYSYNQKDVLYNGKTAVYKKDDGLYTGINSYNFRYEVTTLKGPKTRADLPTREHMLPNPSVNPSVEQMLPVPAEPSGSTTGVQNKVSISTMEQGLVKMELEDAAAQSVDMKP